MPCGSPNAARPCWSGAGLLRVGLTLAALPRLLDRSQSSQARAAVSECIRFAARWRRRSDLAEKLLNVRLAGLGIENS